MSLNNFFQGARIGLDSFTYFTSRVLLTVAAVARSPWSETMFVNCFRIRLFLDDLKSEPEPELLDFQPCPLRLYTLSFTFNSPCEFRCWLQVLSCWSFLLCDVVFCHCRFVSRSCVHHPLVIFDVGCRRCVSLSILHAC